MKNFRIAVVVGSLRVESFNRKMANSLIKIAPRNLRLEIVEINQLSLYNEDLDASPPVSWVEFRNRLREFDGILFLTPEYNRSVPGVLKNAIDIGSRPYGKSVWAAKAAGVISVSIGSLGGFGANHHLRQTLSYLDMPTMAQPEAYIANAATLFSDMGILVDEKSREYMETFLHEFSHWMITNTPEKNMASNR